MTPRMPAARAERIRARTLVALLLGPPGATAAQDIRFTPSTLRITTGRGGVLGAAGHRVDGGRDRVDRQWRLPGHHRRRCLGDVHAVGLGYRKAPTTLVNWGLIVWVEENFAIELRTMAAADGPLGIDNVVRVPQGQGPDDIALVLSYACSRKLAVRQGRYPLGVFDGHGAMLQRQPRYGPEHARPHFV